MKDFDLESRLKNVPVPERTEEYWEEFPGQVRRKLSRTTTTFEPVRPFNWFSAWKMSLQIACVIVALLAVSLPLKAASGVLYRNEKVVRRQLAQLPMQLRIIMADEHGLHALVADQE